MVRHQASCILIWFLLHLSTCQEDVAIGEGLVTIEASCDMKISSCSSPPCRFVETINIILCTKLFNQVDCLSLFELYCYNNAYYVLNFLYLLFVLRNYFK